MLRFPHQKGRSSFGAIVIWKPRALEQEPMWKPVGFSSATATSAALASTAIAVALLPPGLKENKGWVYRPIVSYDHIDSDTPCKSNMEPENEPLEEEIPIKHHFFQVPC